jgi:carbamoyltransferase
MGLAPYGTPRYVDVIRGHLIEFRPDGSYRLNMEYFDYTGGSRMTNEAFAQLFDGPARTPETRITRRESGTSASLAAWP